MEARLVARRAAFVLALFTAAHAGAAGFQTANFVVSAPTPALAREIAEAAEVWRKRLSIEWIGEEMPAWSQKCPITARVAPRLGAGGATTFVFDRGEVFGWDMNIQGSRERILDSVLPHEITHTIFACYFRQPLPRWADEGACTTVEHESEIAVQERLLIDFLHNGKGIPFSRMFAMKDYPADVLPLYAQGHSLTRYLLMKRGKSHFLAFLGDGMRDENWPRAVKQYYGHDNLYDLQNDWLAWVKQGRPELPNDTPVVLAASESRTTAGDSPWGRSGVVRAAASVPMPAQAPQASAYSQAPRASGKQPTRDASRGPIWRR